MATTVPDLLEPPRLTGNASYDSQVMVDYSWASYRALRVALDKVASLGTIAVQDATNVDISGGTVAANIQGAEQTAHKNASSGYTGLSASYQIQFKNTAGTITNLLTNVNAAPRTYTFQDADGTVAFLADIPSVSGFEQTAHKDASAGYVGLSSSYQIRFLNTTGTIASLLTNTNTVARIYAFQDADGTVAFMADITGGANAGSFTSLTLSGVLATNAAAPTLTSAATIVPTTAISFVSGTATIQDITPPAVMSGKGGQVILIPTGLWVTNTLGNIALASTAVVSKALIMVFDSTTGKWYPSY